VDVAQRLLQGDTGILVFNLLALERNLGRARFLAVNVAV
jgi:hypothetical protein